MKVISLRQPWASMVVLGIKKLETRSRNVKHRGNILVHASQSMGPLEKGLALTEPFYSHLKHLEELPLGAIIGMVSIEGSYRSEDVDTFFYESDRFYPEQKQYGWERIWKKNVDLEKSLGDYSPGRYFYELLNPVIFSNQTKSKGSVVLGWDFNKRFCHACGCTEIDCRACIVKTGGPCHWVSENLCSACKK